MTNTMSSGELVEAAKASAREVTRVPNRKTAVLTCMDTRLDPLRILGATAGEYHILRNAGGIVTDDVVRSLVLSQRTLGTSRIRIVMHTDCGVLNLDEAALEAELEADTGRRVPGGFGSFDDLEEAVRNSIKRLSENPFLRSDLVDGYVFDVRSGELRRVRTANR